MPDRAEVVPLDDKEKKEKREIELGVVQAQNGGDALYSTGWVENIKCSNYLYGSGHSYQG
jgi:hypothetical protein